MKTILKFLLVLISFNASSQIILENQYYIFKKNLYLWDIGNSDLKYVLFDSTGFSLYNLDHSPYLLNVVPPIPLWQSPSFYEVAYITKSLFDCDSSSIEYVVTRGNYLSNFYIFRTDGTMLFEKDSVTGPYNIGGFDGSLIQQPIVNTPSGTKLFLQDNRGQIPDSMYIYSLCGTLPAMIRDPTLSFNYVEVYPSPTVGLVNFKIIQPSNQQIFTLTIFNSSFQKVDEAIISGTHYQIDLRHKYLSAGTYFFDLRSNFKIYQTGKFIIVK
jgi:hypothetical protein